MTVDPKKEIEKETPSADGGGGGGRGGGHEGRGGRGKGQSRRGGKSRHRGDSRGESRGGSTITAPRSTFKGECKAIEDAIFDCNSPHQSTNYSSSIKRIADHVGSTYSESGDIRRVIEDRVLPVLAPPDLADGASTMDAKIWDYEFKAFMARKTTLRTNCEKLFSLLLGQSTPAMRSKLESRDDWKSIKSGYLVVSLLSALRDVTYKFEGHKNPYLSIHLAQRDAFLIKQGNNESITSYKERHDAVVGVLEGIGGDGIWTNTVSTEMELLAIDASLTIESVTQGTNADDMLTLANAMKIAREKALAMNFLMASSREKFQSLFDKLENECTLGSDNYPTTRVAALNILVNYKRPRGAATPRFGADPDVSFAQTDGNDDGPNKDDRDNSGILCWKCGEYGHFSYEKNKCPKGGEPATQLTTVTDNGTDGSIADDAVDDKEESAAADAGAIADDYEEVDGFGRDDEDDPGDNIRTVHLAFLSLGYQMAHLGKNRLPPWWVLLDNCSTAHIISNAELVRNIRMSEDPIRVHSSGGVRHTDHEADMTDIGSVYFDAGAIANILSFAKIREHHKINYDCVRDIFIVHFASRIMHFKRSKKGVYYYDCRAGKGEVTLLNTVEDLTDGFTKREVERATLARRVYSMVGRPSLKDFKNMVRSNLIRNCPLTVADIVIAETLFGPDIGSIRGKTVRRAPTTVTTDYVAIPAVIRDRMGPVEITADLFFVNSIPFLLTLGKRIKFMTLENVPDRKAITLLRGLHAVRQIYLERGHTVSTMFMDNEFTPLANDMKGVQINLNTTAAREHVPEIERQIRVVKERARSVYNTLPFAHVPSAVIVELMRQCVMWLNAFPVASGVSDTISPRTIMTGTTLDYKKHCRLEFGSYCETHEHPDKTNDMDPRSLPSLNLGPTGNLQGTHRFLNLRTGRIIKRRSWTELPIPKSVIARVAALAAKDAAKQNNNPAFEFTDRSGNNIVDVVDDDNDILSLNDIAGVGEHINDDFEDPVNDDNENDQHGENAGVPLEDELAPHEEEPGNAGVPLEDELAPNEYDGVPPEDALAPNDNNDEGGEPAGVHADDAPDNMDNHGEPAGVHDGDAPDNAGNMNDIFAEAAAPIEDAIGDISGIKAESVDGDPDLDADVRALLGGNESIKVEDVDEDEDDDDDAPPLTADPDDSSDEYDSDDDFDPDDDFFANEEEFADMPIEEAYTLPEPSPSEVRAHHHMKTRKKKRNYTHRNRYEEEFMNIMYHVMTHYHLKAGLKRFEHLGEEAVTKELKQLHDKIVFYPKYAHELTRRQRKEALRALMFLKQKRTGVIKGRGVADGRPQRVNSKKGESTSPTVSTESVLITCCIDAMEGRDVAVADIPGAFLTADMDEDVYMVLDGPLAEMMVKVSPETYEKYLHTTKKGKKLLYVKLNKALYGCLRSALLFYRKLKKELTDDGFVINAYDSCVANKLVEGSQMTVTWHVDDLKISHVNPDRVTDLLKHLEKLYGEAIPHTRGKKHTYLGMNLDYTESGLVKVSMESYVKEIIEEFPEEITKAAKTCASDHLFRVNAEGKKLEMRRAELFHRYVAKLLFISKRGRPDIQTAVAFLTTRVQSPDEDDWKKLIRMMSFLFGTASDALTLGGDTLDVVRWWVDASYAPHPDMKSHTGGTMSFGHGCITSASKKQKINTTSSCESEIVGVHDMAPQMMWTQYFLQCQGFDVKTSVLYQDNESAILMAKNGRASSSKRTKHINVRYFFIKDRVDSGEVTVEHCSTHDMLADYFTKPLQGVKFREFRNRIMGMPQDKDVRPRDPVKIGSVGEVKSFFKSASLKPQPRPAGVCWADRNRYSALRQ